MGKEVWSSERTLNELCQQCVICLRIWNFLGEVTELQWTWTIRKASAFHCVNNSSCDNNMLLVFAALLYEKGFFFLLPCCMKRFFFTLNCTVSFQNNYGTFVLKFVYTGIWVLLVFADKSCLVSNFLCCLNIHSSVGPFQFGSLIPVTLKVKDYAKPCFQWLFAYSCF